MLKYNKLNALGGNMQTINYLYRTKNDSRIGYEISDCSNNFTTHIHDFYELVYVLQGNAIYGTDTFFRKIPANTLIITPMNSFHNLQSPDGSVYERIVVEFHYNHINDLLYETFGNNHTILNVNNNTFIKHLFLNFLYYHENKEKFTSAQYEKIIKHLIEDIGVNASILSKTEEETTNTIFNQLFLDIISFIDNNITTTNVNEIAQKFSISTTYVYNLFQKNLHISPKKYILEKKLSYAKSLIDAGEQKTDVALICGYTEYAAFHRVYKRFIEEIKLKRLD